MQLSAILAAEPMTVDEYLLIKAEARHWIAPDEADALRAEAQGQASAEADIATKPAPKST